MPTAFGLALGAPHRTILSGGVASPDTVQFTSTSDKFSRSTSSLSGSYTRAYGSLWVTLPAGNVDANMVVGFAVEDTSFTKNFVYFCALDPFRGPPTDFRHELRVNPVGTPPRVPEVIYYPVSDLTNERWIHILFQVDTTQAVMNDRVKVWLGDTKVTAPFDNSDVGLNDTITLGTGPHNIIVGPQDTPSFGVHPATAKIRAAWVKYASSSLFDFEVAADRRYFISASRGYVTHQATMGGQTADFWGAGAVTNWTGNGWTNSGGTSVAVGGITSIPG